MLERTAHEEVVRDEEPGVVVDNRRRNRIVGAVSLAVIVILLLVFGQSLWHYFQGVDPNVAVIAQLKADKAAAEEKARIARAQLKAAEAKREAAEEKLRIVEQLRLATNRPGEGPESPYIRQLMANPQINVAGIEPFTGNLSDRKAIKTWAGREAHLIAINNQQFDPKFGREWRVRTKVGAVYLLDTGAVDPQHVVDYVRHNSPDQPVQIITIGGSGGHSLGEPGHEKGQPYEYLYTGE